MLFSSSLKDMVMVEVVCHRCYRWGRRSSFIISRLLFRQRSEASWRVGGLSSGVEGGALTGSSCRLEGVTGRGLLARGWHREHRLLAPRCLLARLEWIADRLLCDGGLVCSSSSGCAPKTTTTSSARPCLLFQFLV